MGKEDQAEELEILESIYPEELEVRADDEIAVRLHLDTEPPRALVVAVKYPEEYPESVIPILSITADNALGVETADDGEATPDEPRYQYDFTAADCERLKEQADEVAQENLGIPSVFTIVSSIKEQAEDLYEARIRDQESERLRMLTLEEEKEQAKFKGTPVTKASFEEWRLRFRSEMGWDKPKERPFGRLTGKEIFVGGLYKEADEEEAEAMEEERNA